MAEAKPRTDAEMSKKELIIQRLRAEIVSGEIAPGEKLSEARLAERFGVSRMPVRDAFKELENAGFVTVEQRRGTFVRRMSRSEILDLFEVREAVEGMAARLCAYRANNDLLAKMDEAIEAMSQQVKVLDMDGYSRTDERFHELIMSGASNERLSDHYRLLVQHLHRGLLSSIVTRREGRMDRSLGEHVEIMRALHAHDPQGAEDAMRKHVQRGRLELQDEVSAKFGTSTGVSDIPISS
jgi:DNA-binding GntR family transcriptional regulator